MCESLREIVDRECAEVWHIFASRLAMADVGHRRDPTDPLPQEHRDDRAILSLRAGLHGGCRREARPAARRAEDGRTQLTPQLTLAFQCRLGRKATVFTNSFRSSILSSTRP